MRRRIWPTDGKKNRDVPPTVKVVPNHGGIAPQKTRDHLNAPHLRSHKIMRTDAVLTIHIENLQVVNNLEIGEFGIARRNKQYNKILHPATASVQNLLSHCVLTSDSLRCAVDVEQHWPPKLLQYEICIARLVATRIIRIQHVQSVDDLAQVLRKLCLIRVLDALPAREDEELVAAIGQEETKLHGDLRVYEAQEGLGCLLLDAAAIGHDLDRGRDQGFHVHDTSPQGLRG